MTKTNKRALALAIMGNADKLDHPALAVSVTTRFAYVVSNVPNRKGNGGRAIRYRHNCEDLDFEAHFARTGDTGEIPVRLTPPEADDYDEEEDNLTITVTPADLIDKDLH